MKLVLWDLKRALKDYLHNKILEFDARVYISSARTRILIDVVERHSVTVFENEYSIIQKWPTLLGDINATTVYSVVFNPL